jgi:hypothetical protein
LFLLCLLTASKAVFRETSSAGLSLSSIVENNYVFISENTTRWDTARQYEANPIASDSDDESKIIRAENRAIRMKKSKNKSSGPKSSYNVAAIQPPGYSYVPPMPVLEPFYASDCQVARIINLCIVNSP